MAETEIACPTFLVRAYRKDFPMATLPRVSDERHPRDLDPPDPNDGRAFFPLAKLATEITQPPLKAIAERLRLLSYGDMMELATGVGADPAKIWEWANK